MDSLKVIKRSLFIIGTILMTLLLIINLIVSDGKMFIAAGIVLGYLMAALKFNLNQLLLSRLLTLQPHKGSIKNIVLFIIWLIIVVTLMIIMLKYSELLFLGFAEGILILPVSIIIFAVHKGCPGLFKN